MKKYILLVFMLSFLLSGNKSEKYKIEGMHCSYGCVNKIKSVVNSIDGMKSCNVSFENSLMTVEYDDLKVNSDKILSLLSEETTFKTTILNEKNKKKEKSFWSKVKGLFNS